MWKSPDGCSENKNSSRAFCAMRPSPTHRQQSSLLYVKGGPCWPPLFFQFTPFPLCGNGSQGIPQLDQDRPHESQIVIVQLWLAMDTASVLTAVVKASGSQSQFLMTSPLTAYASGEPSVHCFFFRRSGWRGNTVSFSPPSHSASRTSFSSL